VADKTLNEVAKNFRKTQAGATLGKIIFSGGSGITPASISSLLRASGIPVPKEVTIGLDSAQLLLAGGTFIGAASKASSIGALITPSLSAVSAVTNLLGSIGLLDPDSPAAHILNFGTSAALVISSGGLNILADIAFVINLIGELFNTDNRPEKRAQYKAEAGQALSNWFKGIVKKESAAAAESFAAFQNKQISPFQMLGQIAEAAPNIFFNYFPDMRGFVPSIMQDYTATQSGWAHHGGFLGIGRTYEMLHESATITVEREKYKYDPRLYAQFFLDRYVRGPFEPYRIISCMGPDTMRVWGFPPKARAARLANPHKMPVWPRIRLIDLAAFSMLPPYFQFLHDDFDVRKVLASLGLTPFELGYTSLFSQQLYSDLGREGVKSGGGITVNGLSLYTTAQKSRNDAIDAHQSDMQKAIALDRAGDIEGLLKIPVASAIIAEWGVLPYFPESAESMLPQDYKDVPMTSPVGYRNIRNYWGAIAVMENIIRPDPFFLPQDLASIDLYFPKLETLDSRLRDIQLRAYSKYMNAQARQNIAGFFGANPDTMKLSAPEPGKPIRVLSL